MVLETFNYKAGPKPLCLLCCQATAKQVLTEKTFFYEPLNSLWQFQDPSKKSEILVNAKMTCTQSIFAKELSKNDHKKKSSIYHNSASETWSVQARLVEICQGVV